MKLLLSIAGGLILFIAPAFQATAKDHGPGKGHGKGHNKHYYKKPKHYCNAHCHKDAHYFYSEKVIIVQPTPRPGININLPL